ncbi:hypothetical protein [Bacillus cereus]|uniref:hypothetical protein n=1 Tax=Bacillus cereus TaxID=1396 RepID=UPI00084BF0E2|nr:hypothetical protein [Bacillus cereus]OED05085.1 hypothetical protein A9756_08440 [Bacillus cereus]
MVIPTKRIRGTKFIPLIRLLEGLGHNAEVISKHMIDEFIEEVFEDDTEIGKFLKCEITFGAEIANMLLDYICINEPLIKEYFTKKQNLESEYKGRWIKVQEDKKLLMDYVKRFSGEAPAVKNFESLYLQNHSHPLLNSVFLVIAKMQLDFEFTAKSNEHINKYNAIWKEKHFQTTIFNNIITIICSSINAIQANLSIFNDNSLLNKLNNARKAILLQILNLISTEFKIPFGTLASGRLNIPMQDLNFWLDAFNMHPSIGSTIKQIESRERQKQRLSPPNPDDTSNEFYIAKPASAFDVILERLKPLIPIDMDLEDLDDEESLKIFKEIYKQYYTFFNPKD